MVASAIFGGIILACMEGVGVLIGRMSSESYKPQAPQIDIPAPTNPANQVSVNGSTSNSTKDSVTATGDLILEKKGFKFF